MGNQLISREYILKKSQALFRTNGYSNTSMSQLAAECGLSKSHFYYYFRNKEALMEAVLNEELKYFTDKVFMIAYEEAFSPKKRLKKIIKKLDSKFCKGNMGSLILITIYQTTSEERASFYPIIQKYYEEWQRALFNIYSTKFNQKKSQRLSQSAILKIEGALIFLTMNQDPTIFREVTAQLLFNFKKASL